MPKFKKGFLITFEGGEGSGKSTQAKLLFDYLKRKKIPVILTREPGGTEIGEKIREILVTGKTNKILPKTELLLNYAARLEHIERLILPSLKMGKIVISDRFFDSSFAYQGYAHGINLDEIKKLHKFCLKDFKPDLTFVFDVPLEIGLKRAKSRRDKVENRYEKMNENFHLSVKEGFTSIANKNKKRCVLISANDSIDNLQKKVLEGLKNKLKLIF